MLQYLLKIIAPNGTIHSFVLPEEVPLRRLTRRFAAEFDLPHDIYQLVDPTTEMVIPEDATMQSLFPSGAGTLLLQINQDLEPSALPEERYFVLTEPPQSNVQLWNGCVSFIWYGLLIFILTIILLIALSHEYL